MNNPLPVQTDHFIPKPFLGRTYRVLVLRGGWSAEREISLASGRDIADSLKKMGHQVETFDPPRSALALAQHIEQSFDGKKPEIIFNILHGRDVEDGTLQGLLNLTGIPYTFSGTLSSALAMHKEKVNALLSTQGVRCPEGSLYTADLYHAQYEKQALIYPHIVKATNEGSSVHVYLVESPQEAKKLLDKWPLPVMLLEPYIPGREIQVAVFNGQAMGAIELTFDEKIFSYRAKYTKGVAQHHAAPNLPNHVQKELFTFAEKAHKILGCSGITRSDFRYNPSAPLDQQVYFLEINTQPGFTDISLVPEIAHFYGWSYEEVVTFLLKAALEKHSSCLN